MFTVDSIILVKNSNKWTLS